MQCILKFLISLLTTVMFLTVADLCSACMAQWAGTLMPPWIVKLLQPLMCKGIACWFCLFNFRNERHKATVLHLLACLACHFDVFASSYR